MVNQAKMARYRHLIELLNKTNKSLHHTEDAPQDIIIYGGRAAPLVTFLLNPNVVQELRGDKQYNLQMLKERYQVTRLNEGITQHKLVPEETVTVIDSRCGEKFSVYKGSGNDSITQQFDACASWWTQGPDPVFQAELAREMAYTAARFGMLCWASRVYFSDNGSTAIEIALKMAFRKFCVDHETLLEFSEGRDEKKHIVVKVLALRGSYHGDTLGAMEAQAPSPYTGFLQQPCTRDEIFDKSRDTSTLATTYLAYVSKQLQEYSGNTQSAHVGALIIEPVIHGAGGMHMVDPLFQRVLVNECRNRKIPVIFNEVFTGFWRLGVETHAELLGCKPDIACYAKLMTGGMIPLAVTLATDALFDSFSGDPKLQALLHGHSYSAHAMGCATAAKAIEWFKDPETNHNIIPQGGILRELWDEELVQQISCHSAVQRVVVIGTLFALELKVDASNSRYASLYAKSLLQMLREDGIFMRPLGNVVYLMCGPCTSPEFCRELLSKLYIRYRAQISVYDNSDQAVFVLLGDAGFELTGKHAAELVSSYFEANGDQGVTQEVPFPEALISTIGQKHNFCVKVTKHNFDGKSRSLTVTKILPLDTPPVTESAGGNYNPATSEETFETGANVCGASKTSVDPAEGSKRNGDIGEIGKAKRLKRGV
ncbi:hypothetical protein Bca4012_046187 [Brassica carinata]